MLLRRQVMGLQQQVNVLQNRDQGLENQNVEGEDLAWLNVDDIGDEQEGGRRKRQRRD